MLCMLGNFAACPTNVVCIGSLAPRFRVAAASCSARRLCALCVAPFPQHPVGSRLSRLVPRTGPPPSLSFSSSFGDPTARTPASSSGPAPFLPFIFPLSFAQEAHRVPDLISTACTVCVSHPHRIHLWCIASPPFASIKYPWSLLFFFIPILLAYGAELRNPVDLVKLGSSV